jgi:hypothetical protein
MSTFFIKNISVSFLTVFGTTIPPKGRLDLLTVTTAPQIVSSLKQGQLFNLFQGKMLTAADIASFNNIGATQAELDYFSYCGFMQGYDSENILKYPFAMTGDGYLLTSSVSSASPSTTIIRGAAKGTRTAGDITGRSISPNSQALDVYNLSPSCVPGNYSTSRGDASAVRASDTTITFTGPTIISTQLRRVIAFTTISSQPLIWEQGVNAALSYSAGVITVYSIDGYTAPVPATTTLVVVDWVAQDKGYDQSLQALRVAPQYSDRSYRQTDPVSIIAAAQNITASWADLGPEILCDGSNTVCLWVNVDINDALNVRFRALAKHTSAGAVEYQLPTKVVNSTATPWLVQCEGNVLEWNVDGTDFASVFSFDLVNSVKYVQFQVMAGTAGASPGQVLNAETTQGW